MNKSAIIEHVTASNLVNGEFHVVNKGIPFIKLYFLFRTITIDVPYTNFLITVY